MRIRQSIRGVGAAAACIAGLAMALPAAAHDGGYRGDRTEPSWKSDRHHSSAVDPHAREAWLADCRQRISLHDSALGGPAIGGVAGAEAGAAIDAAEDRSRARDECEAYLDDYYARQHSPYAYGGHAQQGYAGAGYANGYPYGYGAYGYGGGCCGQPMMMVPIRRMSRGDPKCTETVEEIVEYVDAPVRAAPRRAQPAPVKRVPDKRVKTVPDKRIRVK